MAERVATGISGLDKMLYGGIPAESQVLLTGGPGAGKSLLSFEYLYRNAKAGNTSIFFAFEEDPEEIIENAKAAFPELADIDDMIGSGKLIIDREAPTGELISATNKDEDLFQFGSIMTKIENRINETKATRVVIDSISILGIMIKDVGTYRKYMLALTLRQRCDRDIRELSQCGVPIPAELCTVHPEAELHGVECVYGRILLIAGRHILNDLQESGA